jgi:uncharacterized membrane protein
MVTTRIIDVVYLIGVPLLYAAVLVAGPDERRAIRVARDVAAFAVGAVVLLLLGGVFARAHGGEFLFFMPQVRVVRSTTGGYNQLPVDQWLPGALYFWVVPFVILFATAVLAAAKREDRLTRRVLLAGVVWLTLVFTPFALWQFLSDGWLFNVDYYFSSFLVPTTFCLAASVAVLLGPRVSSRRAAALLAACGIAILGPVLLLYGAEPLRWIATANGDRAHVVTVAAIVVAILLAVIARWPRVRGAGAAAVVAASFAFAVGIDASQPTFAYGMSDPRTGGLYDVGQQLISYLRANGYSERMPVFWYDEREGGGVLRSLQSIYYYAYTGADFAMPNITEVFRSRLSTLEPRQLVVLCVSRSCEAGARALGQAGYDPQLRSETSLRSDGVRVRVQVYDVNVPG